MHRLQTPNKTLTGLNNNNMTNILLKTKKIYLGKESILEKAVHRQGRALIKDSILWSHPLSALAILNQSSRLSVSSSSIQMGRLSKKYESELKVA